MTLAELLIEHDLLCGPGLPMVEWLPRWRAYEKCRQDFLHQGIDLEVEINKRSGRLVSDPSPEALDDKIAMLETEVQTPHRVSARRVYSWMK